MGFGNARSFDYWSVEFGPLACGVMFLWIKLVFFSVVTLRDVWWAPETPVGNWLLTHVDIFSATLATLMLFFAPLLMLPRVWRFASVVLVDVAVSTLVVSNVMHFRFYGNIIPLAQTSSVHNLKYVVPSIIAQLNSADIIYYLDIIAVIPLAPYYRALCKRVPSLDAKGRRRFCYSLLLVGIIFAAPTFRLFGPGKDFVSAYSNLQREVVATVGLLPYYLGGVGIQAWSRLHVIRPVERQRVLSFVNSRRHGYQASRSNLFGIARGRNVIMIMAESLQNFPIGLKINGQPVAPRISTFAQESLHFVNFYDQTNLATTSDGEFTSLQSLHPLAAGSVGGRYGHHQYYALPAILSHHGYATLSASGESGTMWYMNKVHPSLGFQRSVFQDEYQIRERIGEWIADQEFFTQTIPILKGQREPFLAYMITSSSHHPFEVPSKYHVLNVGELEGTNEGNYLHAVHYFDQAFGEFIDELRMNGLLEESLVVLYGDHQAFLDGTRLGGLLGSGKLSQYDSFQLRKRVPLLIRLPERLAAGIRTVRGGHLDIAPTILSLLGIIADDIVMFGKDLTQGTDSFVVFRDGSFVDGKHLFLNGFGTISASRCYEVASGKLLDCGPLEGKRRDALEQLEMSDLIIRGNLIPFLRDAKRIVPGTMQ